MFKVPEKYRKTEGSMKSTSADGNNGAFGIPLGKNIFAVIIASDGLDWEHVSVTINAKGQVKTPTWNQMSKIKSLFWGPEDVVMQLHPARSQYVNNHPNCLHLWRPTPFSGQVIPTPPSQLVGIRNTRQALQ